MAQKRVCNVSGCENKATPRTSKCRNCGHNINSWSHKRIGLRLEYKQKLEVRNARLSVAIGDKRK